MHLQPGRDQFVPNLFKCDHPTLGAENSADRIAAKVRLGVREQRAESSCAPHQPIGGGLAHWCGDLRCQTAQYPIESHAESLQQCRFRECSSENRFEFCRQHGDAVADRLVQHFVGDYIVSREQKSVVLFEPSKALKGFNDVGRIVRAGIGNVTQRRRRGCSQNLGTSRRGGKRCGSGHDDRFRPTRNQRRRRRLGKKFVLRQATTQPIPQIAGSPSRRGALLQRVRCRLSFQFAGDQEGDDGTTPSKPANFSQPKDLDRVRCRAIHHPPSDRVAAVRRPGIRQCVSKGGRDRDEESQPKADASSQERRVECVANWRPGEAFDERLASPDTASGRDSRISATSVRTPTTRSSSSHQS